MRWSWLVPAEGSGTEGRTAPSRTFRRNVRWQIAGSASQALLGGALLLLIGRQLGPNGFGVFSIVMAYVYLANSLLEPRIQDVAARKFWDIGAGSPSNDRRGPDLIDLFVLEALAKGVPCIALLLAAPWLVRAGDLPSAATLMIATAAIGTYFSKLGYGLSTGLLRVLGRSDLSAYCATGEQALRLACTVAVMALSQLTPFACIAIGCVAGVASNALQWSLTARQVGGVGAARSEWTIRAALRRLRENQSLLLANIGLSISDLMNKDLDVTLASMMMASDRVGIYKMAKSITFLAWRAIDPFTLALMPEVNRLVRQGNRSALNRLLMRSSSGLLALASTVSALAFALLVMFGTSTLGLAFTDVQSLIPWMLAGVIGAAPWVWGHPLAVALNRADIALAGSVLGACAGLLAFVLLVPAAGLRGAGAAWAIAFLVTFAFTAAMAYRRLRGADLTAQ